MNVIIHSDFSIGSYDVIAPICDVIKGIVPRSTNHVIQNNLRGLLTSFT